MTSARSTTRSRSRSVTETGDFSIVAVDKFIRATRDSGYKNTASAIAELVDNSLQAGADVIEITIEKTDADPRYPVEVAVCDNGGGMDPFTLRQALRFGGSSRFNDRGGLGRYGMGLPNASLSQARRVTVYSWEDHAKVYSCALDVDEIASGEVHQVPVPRLDEYPYDEDDYPASGTIVFWEVCDQLDNSRVSTIARKLQVALGRRFRHYLWEGVELNVNGEIVKPIDPLCLHPDALVTGGRPFGDPLEYEVRIDPTGNSDKTGMVRVTFAELPVDEWHDLPNEEKRRRGVSKGAGVSIVRAGREVDYGWFFLGGKRRENYDDWWRCEVHFDPALDEAFGITHTKQQIRPKAYLLEILAPDIEAAARALNARARKAHLAAKLATEFSDAEKIARAQDRKLKPIPGRPTAREREVMSEVKRQLPSLRSPAPADVESTDYRIVVAAGTSKRKTPAFFDFARERGRFALTVNPDHPFFKRLYRPLKESEDRRDQALASQLELLLLAMARSMAGSSGSARKALLDFQDAWSATLATFLNGK